MEYVADGAWQMERGRWIVEDGAWQMERGRWSVADGAWQMEYNTSTEPNYCTKELVADARLSALRRNAKTKAARPGPSKCASKVAKTLSPRAKFYRRSAPMHTNMDMYMYCLRQLDGGGRRTRCSNNDGT